MTDEKTDDGASLLPADPSASVTTEALPQIAPESSHATTTERQKQLWAACQRRTGGHGPCGICQMCRAAAALAKPDPRGDQRSDSMAGTEPRLIFDKLQWVKKFIEYARYELQPGEATIGSQFPHQADADKAIATINEVLAMLYAGLPSPPKIGSGNPATNAERSDPTRRSAAPESSS